MLPHGKIRWAAPEEPVLALLQRMQSEDINQMPVLAGTPDSGTPDSGTPPGQAVGIITRESILRVIQTRSQVGELAGT